MSIYRGQSEYSSQSLSPSPPIPYSIQLRNGAPTALTWHPGAGNRSFPLVRFRGRSRLLKTVHRENLFSRLCYLTGSWVHMFCLNTTNRLRLSSIRTLDRGLAPLIVRLAGLDSSARTSRSSHHRWLIMTPWPPRTPMQASNARVPMQGHCPGAPPPVRRYACVRGQTHWP